MAETIGQFAPMAAPVRPDVRPQQAHAPDAASHDVKTPPGRGQTGDGGLAGEYTKLDNTKLTVSLDADTGTYIYKSVNAADGEVVWQWPSEQVMRVIQYFRRVESMDDKSATKRTLDQRA